MAEKYALSWTPSAHDASKYALEGEQLFDAEKLNDLPSSELEKLEAVILRHAGITLEQVWPPMDRRVGASRATMWLTLALKGVGLSWEEFDPQVRRTVFDWRVLEGDDADPPAESPAETSSPDAE